jgi:hypothetical protein
LDKSSAINAISVGKASGVLITGPNWSVTW